MAFIGVRISWLIFDRKADLSLSLSCAFSVAMRNDSSYRALTCRLTKSSANRRRSAFSVSLQFL